MWIDYYGFPRFTEFFSFSVCVRSVGRCNQYSVALRCFLDIYVFCCLTHSSLLKTCHFYILITFACYPFVGLNLRQRRCLSRFPHTLLLLALRSSLVASSRMIDWSLSLSILTAPFGPWSIMDSLYDQYSIRMFASSSCVSCRNLCIIADCVLKVGHFDLAHIPFINSTPRVVTW